MIGYDLLNDKDLLSFVVNEEQYEGNLKFKKKLDSKQTKKQKKQPMRSSGSLNTLINAIDVVDGNLMLTASSCKSQLDTLKEQFVKLNL